MRFEGKSILQLATDPKLAREHFGSFTHVQPAYRIGQPEQESDARFEIRGPESGQAFQFLAKRFRPAQARKFLRRGLGEEQRNLRHAFRAADQENGSATCGHFLISRSNGFASGSTITMDGDCRHVLGNTCAQRNHARDVAGIGRLRHTTENDFVD